MSLNKPLEQMSVSEKREMVRRLLERKKRAEAQHQTDTESDSRSDFVQLPAYQQLRSQESALEQMGVPNPFFMVNDGVNCESTTIGERDYINFSGYNYLGLSQHEEVHEKAKAAIDRWGTSASASPIATGQKPVHATLESALASFLGTEDCLLMTAGFQTNASVIGFLLSSKDLLVCDELSHASVLAGSIVSGARRLMFRHNDYAHLDQILNEHRYEYERVLIVAEGVYSMDGDIPNLPRLIEIKRRHRSWLMIDEAHSIGVIGKTGRGVGEYYRVARSDVDIWMGTLSKSLASCGGYVAGSKELIEVLKYSCPGFVYSAAMSPANAAAALAALDILEREPQRPAALQKIARFFVEKAKELGLNTGLSKDSGVVPVIVGESAKALQLAKALVEQGINVQPIFYPTVPEDEARLRFFLSSTHTEAQVQETLEACARILLLIDAEETKEFPASMEAS